MLRNIKILSYNNYNTILNDYLCTSFINFDLNQKWIKIKHLIT